MMAPCVRQQIGGEPSGTQSISDTATSDNLLLSLRRVHACRAAGVIPAGGVRGRLSAEPRRATNQLRGQHC